MATTECLLTWDRHIRNVAVFNKFAIQQTNMHKEQLIKRHKERSKSTPNNEGRNEGIPS